MEKARIAGFDYIRAVCALIIVFYHFTCEISRSELWQPMSFFYGYANGNWGEITVVSMFFMLSGAALYYKYSQMKAKDLAVFYKSRWLSLFPSFLMVWAFFYIRNVLAWKNLFYLGTRKNILFSLFGLDGYFLYRATTYYFVGEWFLGAIVLLYLVYPFLLWLFGKFRWGTTVVLAAGLGIVLKSNLFVIHQTRNFITCLCSMWLGMLFVEYLMELKKSFLLLAAAAALLLLLIRVPLNPVISMIAEGFLLFYLLFHAGQRLGTDGVWYKPVQFTGRISYQIFLLQHVVINAVLKNFEGTGLNKMQEVLLLFFCVLVICFFAWVLLLVTKSVRNALSAMFSAIRHFGVQDVS